MTQTPGDHHDDGDLVAPAQACPCCGERHMDFLVWLDEDSEEIQCQNCRRVYMPGGGASDEQSRPQ